jgi:hypothetical protein
MMKKLILQIGFAFSILLINTAAVEQESCDVRPLKNELIKELKPDFKYDSSNTSRFIYEGKKQGTEIQVPLYSTEKYRLLFNTSAVPTDFEIKIYDKEVGSRNRKLLFSVKGSEVGNKNIFVFEPENPRKMYIDYLLPAVEEKGVAACIVFLMGYKIG